MYIILLLLGYLLLTISLYFFQDKIIFQGDVLDKNYVFSFDQPFEEVSISTSNEPINGIVFSPVKGEIKGTILYFHGNADNMQRWGNYAVDFTELGYQVLMIDYVGYGKSIGTPTEEVLYQGAEDTWNWAQLHLPHKNFIIYGRSLGTSIASHLALNHKASQLILETPFYQLKQSHLQIFFPFGLKSEFPNYKYIPHISYPITIIQGSKDWVVSMKSAKRLKPLLKIEDNFFEIREGGHKNLRTFKEYHTILEGIL